MGELEHGQPRAVYLVWQALPSLPVRQPPLPLLAFPFFCFITRLGKLCFCLAV